MSFAENDVFNPLCLLQRRVTHNWHPRALSNYLWIPSPISKQGGSVITWDIAAIMMLRFNNGAAAYLWKFCMECSYAIQCPIYRFIDFTLYQEQVSFANDVCPLLLDLNLLVTFLCVAVATKQERILLNQVKTKKTPQGKVLKRNNIINDEQRILL